MEACGPGDGFGDWRFRLVHEEQAISNRRQSLREVRDHPVVLLGHQMTREDEVGGGAIARDRRVVDHRDAEQQHIAASYTTSSRQTSALLLPFFEVLSTSSLTVEFIKRSVYAAS